MKLPKVVCVESLDSEIHLILQDFEIYASPESYRSYDEGELKKIMLKEALKPLFLMRE